MSGMFQEEVGGGRQGHKTNEIKDILADLPNPQQAETLTPLGHTQPWEPRPAHFRPL